MANIFFRKEAKQKPWRVQIRKKGFPHIHKSFKTEEEAKLFAAETEDGIEKSRNQSFIPKLSLKIWIDRWASEEAPTRAYFKQELSYLKFWEKHLGDEIAIEISASYIEHIADQLLTRPGKFKQNTTLETRRKYLLYLSSLYNFAIKRWKWAINNPLTCIDTTRKKDEKKSLVHETIPEFDRIREYICSVIKQKMEREGLSQRNAASRCNMTLYTFQFASDPKQNTTLKNLIKMCEGFKIKLKFEEE